MRTVRRGIAVFAVLQAITISTLHGILGRDVNGLEEHILFVAYFSGLIYLVGSVTYQLYQKAIELSEPS